MIGRIKKVARHRLVHVLTALLVVAAVSVAFAQFPITSVPTHANITLTNADTEYSFSFLTRTQRFTFQARTAVDIRYAFVTGKVAGPTEAYMTLKSGAVYNSWEHNLSGTEVVYFASGTGGTVVELEYAR